MHTKPILKWKNIHNCSCRSDEEVGAQGMLQEILRAAPGRSYSIYSAGDTQKEVLRLAAGVRVFALPFFQFTSSICY